MAPAVPALRDVSLDDKYALENGRVFLTGTQALVRLLILQRQRDALAGLNTAGFVSGYRGSPLGALDQSLWKAKPFLDRAHITFQPGLNEDLAATSIWGSQQVNLHPGARYDGVFSMWYGKGPGVDHCGDVLKHANHAGTSKHGGVRVAEQTKLADATALTAAVARFYFKLLTIKDEYEVARLYAETDFAARVAAQFEGDYSLRFHLAPPLLSKVDAATGVAKKATYGPWIMTAFRALAKLRGLRGTALDLFGRTAERRMERALIGEYEAVVTELLAQLVPHNHALAVELAEIPEHIRGYGHVKARHVKAAKAKEALLLAAFRSTQPPGKTIEIRAAA